MFICFSSKLTEENLRDENLSWNQLLSTQTYSKPDANHRAFPKSIVNVIAGTTARVVRILPTISGEREKFQNYVNDVIELQEVIGLKIH